MAKYKEQFFESLGRRRIKVPTVTKYKTPWYYGDVKILATEKRYVISCHAIAAKQWPGCLIMTCFSSGLT